MNDFLRTREESTVVGKIRNSSCHMQYARVNPRHDSCCKAQLTFGRLAAGSLGLPVGTAGGGTTSGPPTLCCCVSLESATRRRVEVQQQTMTTANGVRRGQTAVLEHCATARARRRVVRRLPRSQISSKLRLRICSACVNCGSHSGISQGISPDAIAALAERICPDSPRSKVGGV
jgi:hypothetical protein